MAQTNAILRSFGIRYGYYEPSDWKQARLIDPIVETYGDVLAGMYKITFAKENKEQLKADFLSGIVINYNNMIENILERTNCKFLASDSVTIADFILTAYIHNMLMNPLSPLHSDFQMILENYPRFKAYIKVNQEEFSKWNSKREARPF